MYARRFASLVLLTVALPLLIPEIAQAGNSISTHVTWSFSSSRVREGQSVSLKYSVTHEPKGGRVLLERTVGTAKRYRKVAILRHGHATFRAPVMGKYSYRVLVQDASHHTVTSKRRTLFSYGIVTLATLIEDHSTDLGVTPGSAQVGGRLYKYVWFDNLGYCDHCTILKMEKTTCRSLNLTIAGPKKGSASFEVLQETADPSYETVNTWSVHTFNVKLTGGAVKYASTSQSTESHGNLDYYDTYGNGTASCYSPSGK